MTNLKNDFGRKCRKTSKTQKIEKVEKRKKLKKVELSPTTPREQFSWLSSNLPILKVKNYKKKNYPKKLCISSIDGKSEK